MDDYWICSEGVAKILALWPIWILGFDQRVHYWDA